MAAKGVTLWSYFILQIVDRRNSPTHNYGTRGTDKIQRAYRGATLIYGMCERPRIVSAINRLDPGGSQCQINIRDRPRLLYVHPMYPGWKRTRRIMFSLSELQSPLY